MRGRQEACSISSTIQYQPRGGRGVAISDSFQGDRRAFGELGEETPDGAPLMVYPGAPNDLAFGIEDGEEGEELVRVAANLIIRHVAPPANTGGMDNHLV
jgi:hypothetical protein